MPMGKTHYFPLENSLARVPNIVPDLKQLQKRKGDTKFTKVSQTLRRAGTFRNISKVDYFQRNQMCHCFSNVEIFHNIKNGSHVPRSNCTLEMSLEEITV